MTGPQYTPRPGAASREFIVEAVGITEALTSLTYLIELDSGDPGKVQLYANLAEEWSCALGDLLRSAGWES